MSTSAAAPQTAAPQELKIKGFQLHWTAQPGCITNDRVRSWEPEEPLNKYFIPALAAAGIPFSRDNIKISYGPPPFSLAATPEGVEGSTPVHLWGPGGEWQTPFFDKAMAQVLIDWATSGTPPAPKTEGQ
jgi:hypothetical protein